MVSFEWFFGSVMRAWALLRWVIMVVCQIMQASGGIDLLLVG